MVELCLLEVNFFGDGMYVNSMGIGPISASVGYKLSPYPSHSAKNTLKDWHKGPQPPFSQSSNLKYNKYFTNLYVSLYRHLIILR